MAGQAYVIRPGVECYECAVDYARGRERDFLLENHVPVDMVDKLESDWRNFTAQCGYWCGLCDMDNDLAVEFRNRENGHSKLKVAVPCRCGQYVGATLPQDVSTAVPVRELDKVGEFVDGLIQERGSDVPVVSVENPSEPDLNVAPVDTVGLGLLGAGEPYSLKAFLPPYRAALPPQFRGLTREQLACKQGFAYVIMFDEAWVTSMAASFGPTPLLSDLLALNIGFFRDGVGRLIDMQPVDGVLMPKYVATGAVSPLLSLVVAMSGLGKDYHTLSLFNCLAREADGLLSPRVGFVFGLDDVVGSVPVEQVQRGLAEYRKVLPGHAAESAKYVPAAPQPELDEHVAVTTLSKAALADVDGFCYVKLLSDSCYKDVVKLLGRNPTLFRLLTVRRSALLSDLDVSSIVLSKVSKGHLHLDLLQSDRALVRVADIRAFAFKFRGDTLGMMLVEYQEKVAQLMHIGDGGAADKLFSVVGGSRDYGPQTVLSNDAQAQALVGLPGYEYLSIVKPSFVRSVASALGQWPTFDQVLGLAATVLSVGSADLSSVSLYRVGRDRVDIKLMGKATKKYACLLDVDVGSKRFPPVTLGGMIVGTVGYGQSGKFVCTLGDRIGGVRSVSPDAVAEGIRARKAIAAIPGFCYAALVAPLYVREVTARLGPRPRLHELFRLKLGQVDRDEYLRLRVVPGDTVIHLERASQVVRPDDSLAAIDVGGIEFPEGTFGAAVFAGKRRYGGPARYGKVGLHSLVGQATVQTSTPVSTTVAGNVYSMPMAVVIGLTVSVTANVIFLIGLIWVSIARRKKSGGGGWGR